MPWPPYRASAGEQPLATPRALGLNGRPCVAEACPKPQRRFFASRWRRAATAVASLLNCQTPQGLRTQRVQTGGYAERQVRSAMTVRHTRCMFMVCVAAIVPPNARVPCKQLSNTSKESFCAKTWSLLREKFSALKSAGPSSATPGPSTQAASARRHESCANLARVRVLVGRALGSSPEHPRSAASRAWRAAQEHCVRFVQQGVDGHGRGAVGVCHQVVAERLGMDGRRDL